MPFDAEKRRLVRERSGYYCQVCGEWYPPTREGRTELDAHSLNRSHLDNGMSVCGAGRRNSCHQKIHDLTNDPVKLEKISREVASLATVTVLDKLMASGVPEKRIRRVLNRIGSF